MGICRHCGFQYLEPPHPTRPGEVDALHSFELNAENLPICPNEDCRKVL